MLSEGIYYIVEGMDTSSKMHKGRQRHVSPWEDCGALTTKQSGFDPSADTLTLEL